MTQAAPTPNSPGPPTFLAEFENACSSHRLYGPQHPAYRRASEAAAAASKSPLRVSITPKGFASQDAPVDDPKLLPFANRLRSLGLVGLAVQSQLTTSNITALVVALAELLRDRPPADAVVRKLADASAGAITAIPLKLGGLRLVEGTTRSKDDAGSVKLWSNLFAQACGNGSTPVNPAELAQSFESALGGAPSPAQIDEAAGDWARELALVASSPELFAPPAGWVGSSRADGDAGSAPSPPSGDLQNGPMGYSDGPGNTPASRLDAASSFLSALSPNLSTRLLSETVAGQLVPESVVLALAQRLPAAVVLGALSAVDRNNGRPSASALALLRKIAAQAGEQSHVEPPPRTNQELAHIASSLQNLLKTKGEDAYVPEEYLQRRHELSRAPVPAQANSFACPDDRQTARHAAALVLEMVASPDAGPVHAAAGLVFLAHRMGEWIRGGNFEQAAAAMSVSRTMAAHQDPGVAGAARAVLDTPLTPVDLIEGSRHFPDRATAVEAIAQLLRGCEGDKFAAILSSYDLKGTDPGDNPVLEAVRQVLTAAPEHCVRGLVCAVGDKPPLALLAILLKLPPAQAIKAVESIVPHAGPGVRRAVLQQVFRRDIPWPAEMTERLLKDDQEPIRRLAVMRLVRDQGPAVAARRLDTASRTDELPIDVGMGLAELLHAQRKHPEVRAACRRWFWSRRRWRALFSFSFGDGRRAG
jgi:hypothetical protein